MYWTLPERLAIPALHLANYKATARIYGRPMREPKLAAFDEIGQMLNWPSGRALFHRLSRDSRKWNTAVIASSQNPSDILALDVENLMGPAMVGRIESDKVAGEALRLLRIPTGVGYEQVIAGLSPQTESDQRRPREFLYRDTDGNVEKIRIDADHIQHVIDACDPKVSRRLQVAA
jgi:hypothetical protein